MEQELRLLYLRTLQREPSFLETSNYLPSLISGETMIDEILELIHESVEYKVIQDPTYNGETEYDSTLNTIKITNINPKMYDPTFVANGKIGIKTGPNFHDTTESFITIKYDFDSLGRYNNNIMNGFLFTDIKCIDTDLSNIRIENYSQKLNMYNAIFSKIYTVSNHDKSVHVKITHEFIALQQYPYCFLQICTYENLNDYEVDINLYHLISHGSNLNDVEISNDTINNINILKCKGYDYDKEISLSTITMYLFNKSRIEVMGLDESNGYSNNVFNLKLLAKETTSVHLLTGIMSTSDFINPDKELTRILFSIKDLDLKQDHAKKWIDIWNTGDISIRQKIDIPEENIATATYDTKLFQRSIKYSLYTIFSSIRDDVNVEVNLLNLSAIDFDGEIFWNAEMFLIPVLLMLRPKSARILLDFRYKQLDIAKNLALAYGNEGSQYPYKNTVMNYKDVYWESSSPFYVFNTALIAINVWNYYRITLDKHWLHEKGFSILQSSVRFFHSLFDSDLNLKQVLTINNTVEKNNNLTKYLIMNTINNYREACFELSFNVPTYIEELYFSLKHKELIKISKTENIKLQIILPSRVKITTEDNDIVFYNNLDNSYLGKRFGGYSGNVIKINTDSDYEFTIDSTTFIKLYDEDNNEIKIYEGTAIYSNEYGLTDGTVIIRNGNISSYSNVFMNDYTFGKQAFVKDSTKILHNIIKTEHGDILESHFILLNYYSKLFFAQFDSLNKTDIIQDNLIFYESKNSLEDNKYDDKLINLLIRNNLECLLAQDMGLRNAKEYYINKFENTLLGILKNKDFIKGPWGNHQYHALFVFNLLTSMIKLRIRGSINDQRFYTDSFGIDYFTGFVLPKYWDKIVVNYNGKTITVPNEYSKII